MTLTFNLVAIGGVTTVTQILPPTPTPPNNFQVVGNPNALYYDIDTTASYFSGLQVCIRFDRAWLGGSQNQVSLLHYNAFKSNWDTVAVTASPIQDLLCGFVGSLSPFVVVESAPPVGGDVQLSVATAENSGNALPLLLSLIAALSSFGGVAWLYGRRGRIA